MNSKILSVLLSLGFMGILGLRAVAADMEDAYLQELLEDNDFGKLNRYVADEVGSQFSQSDLAKKIGALNGLAKRAKLTESKVLESFKEALKQSKEEGLGALTALDATSRSIALRIAKEEQK